MNDEIDWGQFNGNFPTALKFDTPGTSIVGTITRIRVANFAEGPVPELWIRPDDGEERSVLASQVRLQTKLAELRPASGDRIAIVYTGNEESSKPGKSPAKLFDVDVKKGTGTPPAANGGNGGAPAADAGSGAPAEPVPAAAAQPQSASSLL